MPLSLAAEHAPLPGFSINLNAQLFVKGDSSVWIDLALSRAHPGTHFQGYAPRVLLYSIFNFSLDVHGATMPALKMNCASEVSFAYCTSRYNCGIKTSI